MIRRLMGGRSFAALWLLPGLLLAAPAPAQTLDDLLEAVKRGQIESREVNRERERRFLDNQREQEALTRRARAESAELEKQSEGLRRRFEENEKALAKLREELQRSSGDLEQLGTVFRQAAGDAQALLADSLVTSELPERMIALTDLARTRGIPAPEDIEDLWYELQREMTENGRISRFDGQYFDAQGEPVEAQITRYGVFSARADEEYLRYRRANRRLETLPRQPGSWLERQLRWGGDSVLIDPTRGSLFGLLVERPDLRERVRQGGIVGLIILGLGAIGVLLTLYQFWYLSVQGRRIRRQQKQLGAPRPDNALGRVLLAAREGQQSRDMETLELTIDEAILKETPKLERLLGGIKLLAAVAPLLGLLGTVTGMIETFQAITLFGTGDPKLMAGGISQALVTTVLGLTVAIPLLFLHSLVSTRSRALIQLLDEQSAGMIARRQEQQEPADA